MNDWRQSLAWEPMVSSSTWWFALALTCVMLALLWRAFDAAQTKVLRLEELTGAAAVQRTMAGVFGFVGLEPCAIADPTPKNTREYSPTIVRAARPPPPRLPAAAAVARPAGSEAGLGAPEQRAEIPTAAHEKTGEAAASVPGDAALLLPKHARIGRLRFP